MIGAPTAARTGRRRARWRSPCAGGGQNRWSGTPSEGEIRAYWWRGLRRADRCRCTVCGKRVSPGDRLDSPVSRVGSGSAGAHPGRRGCAPRHRQHARRRHGEAQAHLRQPADPRSLEPEPARQPAVDPLYRTALVVVVLPLVAALRHRREHSPILGQWDAHRVAHRTLIHTRAGDPGVAGGAYAGREVSQNAGQELTHPGSAEEL